MKKISQILLQTNSFSEIVMGNTAIVRAMIESGTKVITSYPGSPTPEIATTIDAIEKQDRPFYFEFSVNEKVATEVAAGASVNGHLSCVFFKSVGLNVAADSFVQLGLFKLIGGMVIVLGDDPGANSSQNEQDNRHIFQMSYIPVFEPSSPQEVYEMYLEATRLSKQFQIPIVLRLTTHVCHAKEKVNFNSYEKLPIDWNPNFNSKVNGPYVPLTTIALMMKKRALERFELVKNYSENSSFHKNIKNGNSKNGIITMGLPFYSLMDLKNEFKEMPNILSLGMIYPLPENKIISFLKEHEEVKIIEELDPIIEKEILSFAYTHNLSCKIYGKKDIDDLIGEYTADKVKKTLSKIWPTVFNVIDENKKQEFPLPPRPAQMCPGCGHRSAFHAIKQALEKEDITVADIGCHTLGFLPPYEMGEVMLCMGASPGLAAGLSLQNTTRRVVAFMGDSTFFHAGIPGIINAIFNKHNLTLVLMENGTTAMTGHQDHPGVGKNMNAETPKIDPRNIFRAFGVEPIEVDAYQQNKLINIIKKTGDQVGVKIIIATHPCMLKMHREQRKKPQFKLRQVTVDQNKCNQKNICVENFACPTFTKHDDGTITVNKDLCIGDGSCIQVCPSKAITPPKTIVKGEA